MGLTFHDWRPLESFDSLANFKPGTEFYVYDPECKPVVFRVFLKSLTRDRKTHAILGIVYAIAPGEEVEVIRKSRFKVPPLPTYAPRNRVGFSRTLDVDYMHELQEYDT